MQNHTHRRGRRSVIMRLLRRAAIVMMATTAACHAVPAPSSPNAMVTRPVVLIPGFASSQLHAWKKHSCSHTIQKNLYSDVNVGDRIWIDAARILAQGDCWLRCMKLHIANQSEIDCKLRAADGLGAISELDPGIVTGPLSTIWRGLIKDLVEHFEFGPEELIVAPYDWRLPPSQLQARDNYFNSLKQKIEHAVNMHAGSGGVVVIAHSMGNNVFRYFLAWLQREVGLNHWQEWIDRYISAFFAVGAPLLGSPEALELITSGITQGLPLAQSEVRKLVATFGSILGFLPIPSIPPTSHDSDVLLSVRYQAAERDGESIERNYTSVDIASGAFFRDLALHDPTFGEMEQARQRFFVQDDVVNAFVPWERPPIASVYAVYGVNLPTKYNYRYQDTDTTGHWYQVALENEEGHRQVCGKTGDATVPYHSLSWAHSWLGPTDADVTITSAPQSVYFSSDQIRQFQATRQADKHHADYLHASRHRMCSLEWEGTTASTPPSFLDRLFGQTPNDQITFFESKSSPTRRTSVWEVEGARHREILGHPAFLRELRAELRHLFSGDPSVGGGGADKSARPPALDGDCYWNYRQAKCEFPEFCEYRYQFGDVTLDQSCRLRLTPRVAATTPKSESLMSHGHRGSSVTTADGTSSNSDSNSNHTPISPSSSSTMHFTRVDDVYWSTVDTTWCRVTSDHFCRAPRWPDHPTHDRDSTF